jgi:hypothetical protein
MPQSHCLDLATRLARLDFLLKSGSLGIKCPWLFFTTTLPRPSSDIATIHTDLAPTSLRLVRISLRLVPIKLRLVPIKLRPAPIHPDLRRLSADWCRSHFNLHVTTTHADLSYNNLSSIIYVKDEYGDGSKPWISWCYFISLTGASRDWFGWHCELEIEGRL